MLPSLLQYCSLKEGPQMNILVLALALALMPAGGQAQGGILAPGNKTPNTQKQPLSQRGIERIVEEVPHLLALLPYYGGFDNLAYKVSPDGSVTFLGHKQSQGGRRGQIRTMRDSLFNPTEEYKTGVA